MVRGRARGAASVVVVAHHAGRDYVVTRKARDPNPSAPLVLSHSVTQVYAAERIVLVCDMALCCVQKLPAPVDSPVTALAACVHSSRVRRLRSVPARVTIR